MESFSVNKTLFLRNQPNPSCKLSLRIHIGIIQYSVLKIAAFDILLRYVNTILGLAYVVGKEFEHLVVGCYLDGQTPTSGRLCRVYRPFKTSVFSLVLA